jgi:hypothetical protein
MSDARDDTLVRSALAAAEETEEIQDSEGRRVLLGRIPDYRGAIRIETEVAEGLLPRPIYWILPKVDERPGFYPVGIPFTAEFGCLVSEGHPTTHASWSLDPSQLSTSTQALAPPQVPVPGSLREAMDSRKKTSGGEVSLEQLAREVDDPEVDAWMTQLMNPAPPLPAYVRGFEDLCRESEGSGWAPEPMTGQTAPGVQNAVFRRDEVQRGLLLFSVLGSSTLRMIEMSGAATCSIPAP